MANERIEVWKDIPKFKGLYKISNLGNVQSTHKEKRILRPMILNVGYKYVCLCKKKKQKIRTIHTLIAHAFIPKIKNKELINHKDGNKLNNSIDNLEWVNNRENLSHKSNKNKKLIGGSYSKKHNSFRASININYKIIYLGTYKTIEECNIIYTMALIYYKKENKYS